MRRIDRHSALDDRRMKMIARANEILANYRDEETTKEPSLLDAPTQSFDAMSRNFVDD